MSNIIPYQDTQGCVLVSIGYLSNQVEAELYRHKIYVLRHIQSELLTHSNNTTKSGRHKVCIGPSLKITNLFYPQVYQSFNLCLDS